MRNLYDDPNFGDEFASQCELVSNCCGAPPLGEVLETAYGQLDGVCSKCKEHATFEKDTSDEREH